MARFTSLALVAAAEAIADSGLTPKRKPARSASSFPAASAVCPPSKSSTPAARKKGWRRSAPTVPMSIANMAAAQIAIRFGLKGMCTCSVTACAGGTNAVGDAFHRIRDGYEPVMVCGGAESCISLLGIGGFTSMKALSTASDPDAASLPFSTLGAAAASSWARAVCAGAGRTGTREVARVHTSMPRWWATVQLRRSPLHAPAPGGAGAIDCMKLALADGQVAPEAIDHINAHGTGTHMNDSCETTSMRCSVPMPGIIAVVSTKSMTGHLLGGAGGGSRIHRTGALRDQFAPPTILRAARPGMRPDYVLPAAHEDGIRAQQQSGLWRAQCLPRVPEMGG